MFNAAFFTKIRKSFHRGVLLLVLVIMTLFLFVNIIFVQSVTPLYQDVANGELTALIRFFAKAKSLKDFQEILPEVNQTFNLYETSVYAEDRKRKEAIQQLESILQKNSQARDVLFTLSLLYKKENNPDRAAYYLQKAKEVDPLIGNSM